MSKPEDPDRALLDVLAVGVGIIIALIYLYAGDHVIEDIERWLELRWRAL